MFEVGKRYNLVMVEDGGEVSFSFKVDAIDGPLIKQNAFEDPFNTDALERVTIPAKIINTTSIHFVSAEQSKFD